MNWTIVDTIHSKGNKFVTGVKIKNAVDRKLGLLHYEKVLFAKYIYLHVHQNNASTNLFAHFLLKWNTVCMTKQLKKNLFTNLMLYFNTSILMNNLLPKIKMIRYKT